MLMEAMDYDEAMGVLCSWEERFVLVVAFVEPGVSLRPFYGILTCHTESPSMLRAAIHVGLDHPVRIAFPSGTFHDAEWVPGMEDRGLSVEQGATRVDIFVED